MRNEKAKYFYKYYKKDVGEKQFFQWINRDHLPTYYEDNINSILRNLQRASQQGNKRLNKYKHMQSSWVEWLKIVLSSPQINL